MEIKKSKKLLKALIATSFVGVVATPIVLTSCSKKVDFADKVLKDVKFEEEEVKNKNDKEGKFTGTFDKNNNTKTLACVVGNNDQDFKSFTIVVTLPFENDAQDDKKTYDFSLEPVVHHENCNKEGKEGFVSVGEAKADENNKKVVKYEVTVNNGVKGLVKQYEKGEKKDCTDLDADKTFTTITFTVKDKKDSSKEFKFVYKVTFAEKK